MRYVAVCAALLLTVVSADARPRKHVRRSAPVIAGEPSVRVTPSGDVVSPTTALRRRDINGKARVRHHRMGPG